MTLDMLKDGQSAVITGLRHAGDVSARLMEMGLFEGVRIQLLRRAPMGDPIEFQIGDYRLSLRRSDASQVEVEG